MASAGSDQSDGEEELKKPVEECERIDPIVDLYDTLGASEDALGVAIVEWLDTELGRGDVSLASSDDEEEEKNSMILGR